MTDTTSTHPRGGDLYTPLNRSIIELFWRMREKHGSWREVAYLTDTRLKVLRRLRKDPTQRTISMTILDRMITATGVGDLNDYVWFTADELVEMGIWDKPADPVSGFPTEWKERQRKRRY